MNKPTPDQKTTLTEGSKIRTLEAIELSVPMRHVSASTWTGQPGIPLPAGTELTYVGRHYFGSDPGPGFPEFTGTLEGKPFRGHLIGTQYNYGGWILKGWFEPLDPPEGKITFTEASGDLQQATFQNACLTTHTLPDGELAISIALSPKLPPTVKTAKEAREYLATLLAHIPAKEGCNIEVQIGPN